MVKVATKAKDDPKTLRVKPEPGDPEGGGFDAKAKARVSLRPAVHGAVTLEQLNKSVLGEVSLSELVDALADQAKAVQDGDLKRPEAMLMTQASTLDVLFHNLTRRAMSADYLSQYEAYMRMALKAQSQARATVAALAEMKNPHPVLIAKQANLTTGPQQVNNGVPDDGSRAGKTQNAPTELLGADDATCTRLVAGTPVAAVRADPPLEAVDAIHRSANG